MSWPAGPRPCGLLCAVLLLLAPLALAVSKCEHLFRPHFSTPPAGPQPYTYVNSSKTCKALVGADDPLQLARCPESALKVDLFTETVFPQGFA